MGKHKDKEERVETAGKTSLRAIVYLVSPNDQDKAAGYSIPPVEMQRWLSSRLAAQRHARIIGEYVEDPSTRPERSVFWWMMYVLETQTPADLILIYSEELLVAKDDVHSALDLGTRIGKVGVALEMCVHSLQSPSW